MTNKELEGKSNHLVHGRGVCPTMVEAVGRSSTPIAWQELQKIQPLHLKISSSSRLHAVKSLARRTMQAHPLGSQIALTFPAA